MTEHVPEEHMALLWGSLVPKLFRDSQSFRDVELSLPGQHPYLANRAMLAASSARLLRAFQSDGQVGEDILQELLAEPGAAVSLLDLIHGQEVVLHSIAEFFALWKLACHLEVKLCGKLCKGAVGVEGEVSFAGGCLRLQASPEDMTEFGQALCAFFNARPQILCDATLQVASTSTSEDGSAMQMIGTHCVVMAAASPFFHALWAGGFSESCSKRHMDLRNKDAATVCQAIQFLYTGSVPATQDMHEIVELFFVADEWQIQSLSKATLLMIKSIMTPASAACLISKQNAMPTPLLAVVAGSLTKESVQGLSLEAVARILSAWSEQSGLFTEEIVFAAADIYRETLIHGTWIGAPQALPVAACEMVVARAALRVNITGKSASTIVQTQQLNGAILVERSNYANNEDAEIEVINADSVEFTKFKTEKQYDFINIGEVKFSGETFPTVEATSVVKMLWHSDGSNTDIGWAFLAKGRPPLQVKAFLREWAQSCKHKASVEVDGERMPVMEHASTLQNLFALDQRAKDQGDVQVRAVINEVLPELLAAATARAQVCCWCVDLLNSNCDTEESGTDGFPKVVANWMAMNATALSSLPEWAALCPSSIAALLAASLTTSVPPMHQPFLVWLQASGLRAGLEVLNKVRDSPDMYPIVYETVASKADEMELQLAELKVHKLRTFDRSCSSSDVGGNSNSVASTTATTNNNTVCPE